MIAVDTSSLRRFLAGESGADVDSVSLLLARNQVVLPPVVLTEILSEPSLQRSTMAVLIRVPLLELTDGYWARAGQLRAKTIAAGHKARIADVLIAQNCLDHDVPLLTNDRDFRHFTTAGLVLV